MKATITISLLFFLLNMNFTSTMSQQRNSSLDYETDEGYEKNQRPTLQTNVSIGLYINRISAVDENKEEISFDVFLQVIWEDRRIRPRIDENRTTTKYVELKIDERHKIWVPDLYIRQLREMKVLSLFEEISSLRLYKNSTVALSIGATIIIKCDMDFVLYPLDVQKCPVDFSSYKYSKKDMIFNWKQGNPISYPNDFGDGFFRLPKYVVSFATKPEPHIVNYRDSDHASARLEITLSREVKSYLLENYLPSTLFVSMSWGSFVVVPEVVPGRMVLLVTTLLSLITMFDTVRNNSPDALELKCIEVWLISCTIFVFLALMEYFIVLFGIRYDKHWRSAKRRISSLSPPPTINLAASGMSSETPTVTVVQTQRKNGVEHGARVFNFNKVNPENSPKALQSDMKQDPNRLQVPPLQSPDDSGDERTPTSSMHRKRFRNVAEYALLYAGSQRGKLDQISLIVFPLTFFIFAVVYWILYLSESRKKI
ncbi:glycine receptor subunit alpha-4-like isoform X2 [Hermetia illucens]|uniref:glycine receptor subunit alpha-4-like isoform X2 n=1 Tax=Hermetia illucens TaxID=343691 RepID=UPI0018CC21E9|nr:glycine receptor subunit alpha-4-like isoform X2 [Hermetia illucens]